VLDGEVAIYDQERRSRFEWLREPDPDSVATPSLHIALDLLYFDGRPRFPPLGDAERLTKLPR
jgi:ATP-dependent DNA ligase